MVQLALKSPLCYYSPMFRDLKSKVDRELKIFSQELQKSGFLKGLPPLIATSIKDFILADGKRIRPIFYLSGYLGFKKKPNSGLFESSIAIELLHDFFLIHDDIIDKSLTRRGKPSMHTMFNNYLSKFKNLKFSGEDLSIVIGDIVYALAVSQFMLIKESQQRKEKALNNFLKSASLTAGGEFIELILNLKKFEKITKADILKVYDYKTAHYTFSSPLTTGAILAGADKKQIGLLFGYGLNLGRAFQIKDDILGIFGDEKRIGKSTLTDLQEEKKTLIIWYAHKKADLKSKKILKNILSKKKVTRSDLKKVKNLIIETKALNYCLGEIKNLEREAKAILSSSKLSSKYKNVLLALTKDILNY